MFPLVFPCLRPIPECRLAAFESVGLRRWRYAEGTPLNAIVWFSRILATTDDKAEKQEYINIIENNNDLLLQLIGDILDLSKVEAGTMEFNCTGFGLNEQMANLENT